MILSVLSTKLFSWLQEADFYKDVHRNAVALLPKGAGQTWMDIGCGPGLVARLAAESGYHSIGLDRSPEMIAAAQQIAKKKGLEILFKTGDLFNLSPASAQVVSAASLLAVLPDKAKGLNALWQCVQPGGSLLVIEPTDQMTLFNANRLIKSGLPRRGINGLRLWALARQGNAVHADIMQTIPATHRQYTALLGGMIGAWVFSK